MSHLAVWIQTPLAKALGWTLVHFVWEGAVLAAFLMALLMAFRAAPARRRYALACLILAAMPLAFGVTLAVVWMRRPIAMPVASRDLPARWSGLIATWKAPGITSRWYSRACTRAANSI
jgi:hypothetical protein